MTIEEFCQTHSAPTHSIKAITDSWVVEKQIDGFLETTITGGVTIGDYLCGQEFVDSVPNQVRSGFEELMEKKADSLAEVRQLLYDKWQQGEPHLRGLLNKIQGQIGENEFKKHVGRSASLAESGSQRGWDVKIGDSRYVQVKVYHDADAAIEELQALEEDIAEGLVADGDKLVTTIDFAVNSEIYADVSERAATLGLKSNILDLGTSREEIREWVTSAADNVCHSPFENFLSELLHGVGNAAAIHAASNAFLVWKKAKSQEKAVEDTIYSSIISSGGLFPAFAIEAVLARAFLAAELETAATLLASPVGGTLLAGVGMYGRGILRRLADRRSIADKMTAQNERLRQIIRKVESM
jgi:hypothetical protein